MRRFSGYLRRGVGATVGLSPVALAVASFASALRRGNELHPVGLAITVVALAIGALNFHLSFVGPLLYRRAHGSLAGYRHVSGFPFIGTLIVLLGAFVGYGSAACAAVGLLTTAIDTGGSVWFLIATWKDRSFWE